MWILGLCESNGLSLGSMLDAMVVEVGDSMIGCLGEVVGQIG